YRKSPSRKAGDFYYDYERNFYKIRLHDFGGKDIMLDAIFTKTPVEVLNAWNGRAKFSRAVLHKPAAGQEYAALESNLDILGGVTEETIRHFIRTFDNEIKLYDRFIGEYGQMDKVYTLVSDEMVEEALKVLGIPIKKSVGRTGTYYDYPRNKLEIRLTNFGGKDLMVDVQLPKVPLEKVNQWNLSRKFIRAVAHKGAGREYTALEANLDCAGGVSQAILQHFIRTFDGEVAAFERFLASP